MNDDTNLIDISMLQQLQDQFCCADHLYLMCVDKNKGVVTKNRLEQKNRWGFYGHR